MSQYSFAVIQENTVFSSKLIRDLRYIEVLIIFLDMYELELMGKTITIPQPSQELVTYKKNV